MTRKASHLPAPAQMGLGVVRPGAGQPGEGMEAKAIKSLTIRTRFDDGKVFTVQCNFQGCNDSLQGDK